MAWPRASQATVCRDLASTIVGVVPGAGLGQPRVGGHPDAVEPDLGLPDPAVRGLADDLVWPGSRGPDARRRRGVRRRRRRPGRRRRGPRRPRCRRRCRCRSSVSRPSSTHSSPSRCALVSSATTSEPWLGSVSAKAPSTSQVAIRGRYCARCSAEPSMAMVVIASPECTALRVAMLPSPRASSAAIMPFGQVGQPGAAVADDGRAGDAEPAVARRSSTGNSARSQ